MIEVLEAPADTAHTSHTTPIQWHSRGEASLKPLNRNSGGVAVPLVIPVMSLFTAPSAPRMRPPPAPVVTQSCVGSDPIPSRCHHSTAVGRDRFDRMIATQAMGEIERLRQALGVSQMAQASAQSALHREKIAGALDRRASVSDANAAAARHAPAYESFGQPIRSTMPAPIGSGSAGTAIGRDAGASEATGLSAIASTQTIVVRSRSLIDLFA